MYSGEKIKALRKQKLWSQEELAENAGLSLRTIQRLEKGSSQPQPHTIKSLAEALNVESEEFSDVEQVATQPLNHLIRFNSLSYLVLLIPFVHLFVLYRFWKKHPSSFGKKVISFQIIWTILTLLIVLIFVPFISYSLTGQTMVGDFPYAQTTYGLLLVVNVVFALRNTAQLAQGKIPRLSSVPVFF